MAVRLNEEQLLHLIELYELHPCLWNVSHLEYKSTLAREEAYVDILHNLNLPELNVVDIRNKLKSLRGTYNQELSKVLKSKQNGNYIYKPHLSWYHKMDSFLRKTAESRKYSLKRKLDADSKPEITFKLEPEYQYSPEVLEILPTDESNEQELEPSPKKVHISTLKSNGTEVAVLDLFKNLSDRINSEECEFNLFGKYISVQLKKLPLATALNLQQQIFQLVTNERVKKNEDSSL